MFTMFWKNQPVKFDVEKTYARIEFLTEDQKVQKDIILNDLLNEYKDDFETIIPYEDSFKCCLRDTVNFPFKTKIKTNELLAHLQVLGGQVQQFLENEVDRIVMVMQNNQQIHSNSYITLCDQKDSYMYIPQHIVEIIIVKKSTWSLFKYKAKKVVKSIPGYLVSLLLRIVNYFLSMMGLSSTSLVMKMIPIRTMINWLLTLLALMFPPLIPLLGLSKVIL